MSTEQKIYLGDGAYAEFAADGLRIYTTDGMRETNCVYLENRAIFHLIEFSMKFMSEEEIKVLCETVQGENHEHKK